MKKSILLIWIAVLLISFSCEKKPTGPTTQKPSFTVYGVVVKDLNISKDIAYFTVSRNDTLFNAATVKVGNKTIPSIGSGSYFSDTMAFVAATSYTDSIISAQDTMAMIFNFALPGTFLLNPIRGNDSLNVQGHSVTVTWTPSDSASGYFMCVVKGDSISGAKLYAGTVPVASGTQATITPDVFRDVANNPVPGYYWVYIVAYNKSFVGYPGMPFPLPAGLPAGNIAGATGTLGAGVIAPKGYIYVTTGL